MNISIRQGVTIWCCGMVRLQFNHPRFALNFNVVCHKRGVAKDNSVFLAKTVVVVRMAEKVQTQSGQLKHLLQNLAAAILANAEALLPVENAERRLVRDKHLSISGDGGIVHITRAVDPHSVNGYAAVLQKVDVGWQVLDIIGIVKAQIVVADNENLVLVGQLNEPIEKFQALILRSEMGEIAAVDNHIGIGQTANLTVKPVGVGKVKDFHFLKFQSSNVP